MKITFIQQLQRCREINYYLFCSSDYKNKTFKFCDLIKVGDDVVEEAETLNVLMKDLFLLIEVGETRQTGEEDADSLVRLRVQLLQTHIHTQLTPGYIH